MKQLSMKLFIRASLILMGAEFMLMAWPPVIYLWCLLVLLSTVLVLAGVHYIYLTILDRWQRGVSTQ